jgi:hypothetical protein
MRKPCVRMRLNVHWAYRRVHDLDVIPSSFFIACSRCGSDSRVCRSLANTARGVSSSCSSLYLNNTQRRIVSAGTRTSCTRQLLMHCSLCLSILYFSALCSHFAARWPLITTPSKRGTAIKLNRNNRMRSHRRPQVTGVAVPRSSIIHSCTVLLCRFPHGE